MKPALLISHQWRLKNCTARSCCLAFSSDENVPKLRRLPVCGFFLREYSRYSPDLSLRIIHQTEMRSRRLLLPTSSERDSFQVPLPGPFFQSITNNRFSYWHFSKSSKQSTCMQSIQKS